jgi:hypothetical protein
VDAEKNNTQKNSSLETMSFNDNCETPVIAQVDSPADLKSGIVEISNKDEYIDEP